MQTVELDQVIAMTPPHSFTLDVPEKTIAEIKKRVAAFPWHEMPDDGGWEYGINLNYMREFCAYWVENFDWFKQQDGILLSRGLFQCFLCLQPGFLNSCQLVTDGGHLLSNISDFPRSFAVIEAGLRHQGLKPLLAHL